MLDKEKEETFLREKKRYQSGVATWGGHDSSLHMAETNGLHFQTLLLPRNREHGLGRAAPLLLQSACVTTLSLPLLTKWRDSDSPSGY